MTKNIPLALELYSLRDECKVDMAAALKATAQIGYTAVEFAGYFDHTAEQLKMMLDENGLKCAGTHTSFDTLSDENLEATAKFNATLGNPYLIVPGVGGEYQGSRDGAMRLAEKLAQASKTAAEFGAQVGYHNHMWEFTALPNGDFPLELMAINTPPEVIFQFDTGNAQEAGFDAVSFLEKWKNRLKTVHLKPYATDFSKYFVGEDDTDWPAIFAAMEGAPTAYYIVEQERYPEPLTPQECVARCYKNLKAMGK